MNKSRYNVVTALLGVILGVLVTMVALKMMPDRKFDGDYDIIHISNIDFVYV